MSCVGIEKRRRFLDTTRPLARLCRPVWQLPRRAPRRLGAANSGPSLCACDDRTGVRGNGPNLWVNGPGSAQADFTRFDALLENQRQLRRSGETLQPFGIAGGLYDDDTGLVRFGARDYDPATGRWIARDPIRWAGGQSNVYEYVANNPVGATDAEGTGPIGCTAVVVACAALGAYEAYGTGASTDECMKDLEDARKNAQKAAEECEDPSLGPMPDRDIARAAQKCVNNMSGFPRQFAETLACMAAFAYLCFSPI